MRFRLLGALAIEADDGRSIDVTGFKLRSLLAFFLLHKNDVVTRDALISGMWNDSPPPSANHGLDVLISRLRRLLCDASDRPRLRTVPGGYVLDVLTHELDVDRFEDDVAAARKAVALGRYTEAVELFRRGLAEWHGAALGDVAFEFYADSPAILLEELRVDATEELLEAELRLGRHHDVVPALEALVADHPLRERTRASLMLALYRSGRHAEALEAYRRGHRLLADEQGLEPCAELRRLEFEILRQEPALSVVDRVSG